MLFVLLAIFIKPSPSVRSLLGKCFEDFVSQVVVTEVSVLWKKTMQSWCSASEMTVAFRLLSL